MRGVMCAAAIVVAQALMSCGTAHPLNDVGRGVAVTVDSQVADCAYVATVTSSAGANGRSYESNVERASEEVRNKAGERGATHIVLEAPTKTNSTSWKWTTGECNNCVAVTAQAYRCTGPRTARRAAPRVASALPEGMGDERGECYPNRTCNGALVCLSGLCVDPDPNATPEAIPEPELDRCAAESDPVTCTTLGGELVARDDADARARGRRYLETACNAPVPDACATLGYDLSTHATTRAELAAAVSLFERACAAQSARGCMFLGAMYETGQGVTKDRGAAYHHYDLACQAGTAAACTRRDTLAPR